MITWLTIPFFRYTLSLILGILTYTYIPSSNNENIIWLLLLFIGIYTFVYFFYFNKIFSGVILFFTFYVFGICLSFYHDETQNENHISHYLSQNIDAFSGVIENQVLETEKSIKIQLSLDSILINGKTQKINGKILVYLKKTDSLTRYSYGDYLYIKSKINEIVPPKNPYAFDYKQYLHRKEIFGQCFVAKEKVLKIGVSKNEYFAKILSLKEILTQMINKHIGLGKEAQISIALALGDKSHLDEDLEKAYASSGAMHLLAVSGLHVGIVFSFFLFILKPLEKMKGGNAIIGILLILILWFYAIFTGMTPSVMRATNMFTIFSLKKIFNKKINFYNTLGFTAFIMLLFEPNYIFEIGFQLSFLAVFGIVYFYEKFYEPIKTNNKILNYVLALLCVSFAAQISTFPLSIYAFNQFPTYFFLTNIFSIPLVMLIVIALQIFLIVGFFVDVVAEWLGFFISKIIFLLNESIFWVENLPFSIIKPLHFSVLETFLVYAFILFLSMSFISKRKINFYITCIILVFFVCYNSKDKYEKYNQKKAVFYSITNNIAFDLVDGNNVFYFVKNTDKNIIENLKYQINPNRTANFLPNIEVQINSWNDISPFSASSPFIHFVWNGKKIIILNQNIKDLELKEILETDLIVLSREASQSFLEKEKYFKYNHLVVGADVPFYIAQDIKNQINITNKNIHFLTEGYWEYGI